MSRLFEQLFMAGCTMCIMVSMAACSSPEDKGQTGEEAVKEVAEAAGPKSDTVYITQMNFVPNAVLVNKGDTIVFVNNDPVDHDITEEVKKAWSSSPLHSGQSWAMVAEVSSSYYCSLHPVMKGQIVVE